VLPERARTFAALSHAPYPGLAKTPLRVFQLHLDKFFVRVLSAMSKILAWRQSDQDKERLVLYALLRLSIPP
jgi:hypothetical protein